VKLLAAKPTTFAGSLLAAIAGLAFAAPAGQAAFGLIDSQSGPGGIAVDADSHGNVVGLAPGLQNPHPAGLRRSSPHYDPLALRVPWLHAARAADQPPTEGAPSLFDEAVHSERYWLRVQNLGHADYTSYGLVEGRGEAPGYWSAVTPARTATHRVVAEYVLHFFAADLAASDVSMALLDQARQAMPPESGSTPAQPPATPPPSTRAQFSSPHSLKTPPTSPNFSPPANHKSSPQAAIATAATRFRNTTDK
jgi:hypothetical protein